MPIIHLFIIIRSFLYEINRGIDFNHVTLAFPNFSRL